MKVSKGFPSMKKKWCRHNKWNKFYEEYMHKNDFTIGPPWNYCPTCGKKRPKGKR